MHKLTLKFTRLSAVIVLTICMLCGNNVKTYAQAAVELNFSPSKGTTLTGDDVHDALDKYAKQGIYKGGPFHAIVENATIIGSGAFCLSPLLSIKATEPTIIGIGESAFGSARSLKEINNFDNVEYIGDYAFSDCTFEYLPRFGKVTRIGKGAFQDCAALVKAEFPKADYIGNTAFNNCTALADINFPEATFADDRAFRNCTALKEVELPNAMFIGDATFMGCTALTGVFLPEVTDLGESAFENCKALLHIDITNVTEIKYSTFYHCTSLASGIEEGLMEGIFKIGESAFEGCTSIKNTTFAHTESIARFAFSECTGLEQIGLPMIKSIEKWAFESCPNLKYASFGTGHTTAQVIAFSERIFGMGDPLRASSPGIELVIGENVLPKPEGNNWNGYTWKSITVQPAPTGIKEVIKSDAINVYPNPAKETATVIFELERASDVKITLVDMSGKDIVVVYNGFAPAGMFTETFGTAHLPSGVYLLNVSVSGDNTTKKIIIE